MKGFWIITAAGSALIAYVAVFSPTSPIEKKPIRTLGDVWREECTAALVRPAETIEECVNLKAMAKAFEEINKRK
jgi:hypothetical protein